MSIPSFDHLMLLIGTNPIPNYVVARYLLNEAYGAGKNPQIHLFHSDQTLNVSDRIETALVDYFDAGKHKGKLVRKSTSHLHHLSDAYRPDKIEADVKNVLNGPPGLSGDIHLNHTGGTKSMAVEAALVAFARCGPRLTRSYLNPSEFKLNIGAAAYPTTGDLRDIISPSIEDLMKLHNCAFLEAEELVWQKAARAMLEASFRDKGNFFQWRREWLRPVQDKIKAERKQLKKFDLKEQDVRSCQAWASQTKEALNWSAYGKMSDVLTGLLQEENPLSSAVPADWGNGEAARFIHFLGGGWLELLLCDSARRTGKWDEIIVNCYAKQVKALDRRQMELDVLARRGYSLTLFSCTTSNEEKEIKLKCFEATQRAQQLGGEEAQAVMVSNLAKADATELFIDLQTDHTGRVPLKFISQEGLRNLDASVQGIAGHGNKETSVY